MRLSRWMTFIGIVVGLGCLRVSQRNAIYLQGYAVGSRATRLHAQETDLAWLRSRVNGLSAPSRLAQIAEERRMKLVAWSPLPEDAGASPSAGATAGLPRTGLPVPVPGGLMAGLPVPSPDAAAEPRMDLAQRPPADDSSD